MTEPGTPAFNVLILTDGSPGASRVIQEAIRLLPLRMAHVYLLAVTEPVTAHQGAAPAVQTRSDAEPAQSRQQLEVARLLLSQMDIRATVIERTGRPAEEILSVARALGIDLIVLGTPVENAVERWVHGSVSHHVLHHFPGAVMIVRPEAS